MGKQTKSNKYPINSTYYIKDSGSKRIATINYLITKSLHVGILLPPLT
jgi:hypothetical protein